MEQQDWEGMEDLKTWSLSNMAMTKADLKYIRDTINDLVKGCYHLDVCNRGGRYIGVGFMETG